MQRLSMKSAAALALAAVLASCAGPGAAPPADTTARPKLVVFLAVDGLPMWQVTAYRAQLQSDGFARFLDRGAWFAEAHYAMQ